MGAIKTEYVILERENSYSSEAMTVRELIAALEAHCPDDSASLDHDHGYDGDFTYRLIVWHPETEVEEAEREEAERTERAQRREREIASEERRRKALYEQLKREFGGPA